MIIRPRINMDNYNCELCGKSFKRKENLDYHKSKIVCEEKAFGCKFCSSKFTSKSTMYRHMREYCKVKKQNDNEKTEIYNRLIKLEEEHKKAQIESKTRLTKLENENKKLRKTVKTLQTAEKTCISNSNSGVVLNAPNNGTVNNITLVAYGNENISKIDKNDLLKVLKTGYHSTIKLTETVHFNPKYPEYHNIYISNMKDKYAMMFDGKKWTLTMKEDLINKIYDDKKNYIEENLEEFVDSLPSSRKKALERWLETDDEDPKIKEIKDNIKLLLYNSRKMICNEPLATKTKSIKVVKDG
ncbi:hypothetical protein YASMINEVIRUS_953 [Yasminevirus sp. GU-2018]|uniref:C2H2-type domain-containing protein n=1 Tax=Yasminevirus sp. GU-2018 TaxID=2420051 RepID=A0A5K0U9V3_9VIRU|nr:hypothetical protein YASMINEVIRUS_953 [Yasminevirus sp. GU-2018]